jgi:hypothetical protein
MLEFSALSHQTTMKIDDPRSTSPAKKHLSDFAIGQQVRTGVFMSVPTQRQYVPTIR